MMSKENGTIEFDVKGKGIDIKFFTTTLLLILNGVGVYTNQGSREIEKEISEFKNEFTEYKETSKFEMQQLGFRVTHLEAIQKGYSN